MFKNFILNPRRWKDDIRIEEDDFAHVPIWVQLWGMPKHYKTVELSRKIGGKIGDVEEVDFFQMKGKESRILKVKVKLDVAQVLKDSINISRPNKKVVEIAVKYEKIGCFCHFCSRIGHETRYVRSSSRIH